MLLAISVSAFGQKFMIKGKDTLPYKDKMVIQKDTYYSAEKTYYPGDTLYEGTCWSFEKINGRIVNQTDSLCLQQGLWIISDSLKNYWTGIFQDGKEIGIWRKFDKRKKLIKETERVHLGKDTYVVTEIDYSSGHPATIIDRAFLAFYIKNFFIIMALIFVSFFGRVFINSKIYNVENETDYSPVYFYFPGYVTENFQHSLLCTFTLWFFTYKQENKRLVIFSNILSLIALSTFFAVIIGLAINGEPH
jgi:hypothetical protein